MKLFVILSRFPYPLDKGDKLRAYYQLRDLSKDHDIYLACITSSEIEDRYIDEVQKFCKQVHTFKIGRAMQLWKAFTGLFSSQPIQVKMFYSKTIHNKIRKIIDRIQPDHIFCQLIRVAEYVKKEYNTPKTIDYMDALSTGMSRMSNDSRFPMKSVYSIEARRLTKYENLIYDYFDNHVIISKQDKELIYHPDRKNIAVIPNGVDLEKLEPLDVPKRYDLVFHGNMSYPPNIASAQYIVNKIMTDLEKKGRKVKVLISGTNPHPSVRELASEDVTVSGWVDDIRDSYCASRIFVAPMIINTGLQNKILEAMSLGIPCITTTMANNAIGASKNSQILIADTAAEFTKKIIMLLDNKDTAAEISANARNFVANNYSWKHNNAKLATLFSR